MQLLEWAVEEEAAGVREQLLTKFKDSNARKAAAQKWDGLRRLALIPRTNEMMRWLELDAYQHSVDAPKSIVDPKLRHTTPTHFLTNLFLMIT